MNAVPPTMTPGKAGRASFGQGAAGASSRKWAALQEAANVVATLAGLEQERPGAEVRNFPALIKDAAKWRRELADQQIDDMTAMMQPGIAALLGVNARGADPRPAALALWREYVAARGAVLALLPPSGNMGPPRTA
ncbi:hypothetical protein GRI89_12745 [Altererythrobacter salegens]|uniref:Uncharacterized protein n=1 Tax=Croceibacterium salegens TaxID=1737568 RepID=A0A6I4SWK2_9SPHN|nr:hypothetical protein [Croceibacterium salegens]MXO60405.1 hypothetical protein [Croceibacterium salegens]